MAPNMFQDVIGDNHHNHSVVNSSEQESNNCLLRIVTGNSNGDSSCPSLLFDGIIGNNNNNNSRFVKVPRHNPASLQDAEKTISQELYQMSLQEREGALHDVHGVADNSPEDKPQNNGDDPENSISFVSTRLKELELELQQHQRHHHNTSNNNNNNFLFPSSSSQQQQQQQQPVGGTTTTTTAFQIAMTQSPDYVRSQYLLFLRSEDFHVPNAAKTMIQHYEMKRQLFGVERLGRDITLQDLDPADMECLKAGFLQLLPQRDRSGRAVLFKAWSYQTYRVHENVLRVLWYIIMVAMIDEETQKKGIVVVLYNIMDDDERNWKDTFDGNLFHKVGKLVTKMLPLKTPISHYCFQNPAFGTVIKFISLAMDKQIRARSRLHQGNHVEVQYELMSFGIPTGVIPINAEGELKLKEHYKFIQRRHKQEELQQKQNQKEEEDMTTTIIIIIPSRMDVLYGRSPLLRHHIGNMKLNDCLEQHGEQYSKCSTRKLEKMAISKGIVETLQTQQGTRFLKQDKDGLLWQVVDDKTAAQKVSQGFRNRKTNSSSSSTTTTTTTTTLASDDTRRKGDNDNNNNNNNNNFNSSNNNSTKQQKRRKEQQPMSISSVVNHGGTVLPAVAEKVVDKTKVDGGDVKSTATTTTSGTKRSKMVKSSNTTTRRNDSSRSCKEDVVTRILSTPHQTNDDDDDDDDDDDLKKKVLEEPIIIMSPPADNPEDDEEINLEPLPLEAAPFPWM